MALLCVIFAMVVISALERVWPARREASSPWINMGAAVTNRLAQILLLPLVAIGASRLSLTWSLPSLHADAWPLWASLPVYVLAMDLGEYAFHRAQHAIPFLWRMHALHHSDPCMGALTTERHFWAEPILKAVTIWPAAAALVAPGAKDVAIYTLMTAYHVFVHANLPVNFGRFSWVLNSPAYHRVHHSREPADSGVNFSALFPIFDVILGSYRRPRHTPRTGLEREPRGLGEVLTWPMVYRRR